MGKLGDITHVIFDMDGLLIDTENIYTQIQQSVLDEFGHTFSWAVKSRQMGRPKLEACKVLVDSYDLPITPEQVCQRTTELEQTLFPNVDLLPGAERLIRHLHASKVTRLVLRAAQRVTACPDPMHHSGKSSEHLDAPNGVEAALASGSKVVMVPDSRVDQSIRDKATLALTSLEKLDLTLFNLPPFPES